MSYNLSIILSMIFVVSFFVFSIDLTNLQYIYSELDSKAVSVSYQISKNGTLDDGFIKQIESYYDVSFSCLSNSNPKFGDIVTYTLSTVFDPLIISNGTLNVSVKRSTVIGYYD